MNLSRNPISKLSHCYYLPTFGAGSLFIFLHLFIMLSLSLSHFRVCVCVRVVVSECLHGVWSCVILWSIFNGRHENRRPINGSTFIYMNGFKSYYFAKAQTYYIRITVKNGSFPNEHQSKCEIVFPFQPYAPPPPSYTVLRRSVVFILHLTHTPQIPKQPWKTWAIFIKIASKIGLLIMAMTCIVVGRPRVSQVNWQNIVFFSVIGNSWGPVF